MRHLCPVCGYDEMSQPPIDFYICPSCGTEFEVDDFDVSHRDLRLKWLENPVWFSQATDQPADWSPFRQVEKLLLSKNDSTTSSSSAAFANDGDLPVLAGENQEWYLVHSGFGLDLEIA